MIHIRCRNITAFALILLSAGCGAGEPPRGQAGEVAARPSSVSASEAHADASRGTTKAASDRARRPSRRSRGYRFEVRPVVLFALHDDGSPVYAVYLRLNKALPRERELILINGSPYESPFRSSIPSFCYTQRAGGADITPALARPRNGMQVTVTVGLTDLNQLRNRAIYLVRRVTARRVSISEINNGDKYVKPRLRRLGCRQPRK